MAFPRFDPAEQQGRNAARRAANLKALAAATLRPVSSATMAGGTTGAAPKAEKADPRGEQAHKDKLAALGCMVCRRLFPGIAPGPVQLHHLRTGGWGKGDYMTLIPVCQPHHTGDNGIHGLGTKGFPKRYGFDQVDLLMDAMKLLGETT